MSKLKHWYPDIKGKCRKTYGDYDAYIFRNNNASAVEEEYFKKSLRINEGMKFWI
jgi:hypothetical protein